MSDLSAFISHMSNYDHYILFQGMERKISQSTYLESCKHWFPLCKMTRTTFVPLFLATIRLYLCAEDPQFLQLFLRLVSLFHKYVCEPSQWILIVMISCTGIKLSICVTDRGGGGWTRNAYIPQQKLPVPSALFWYRNFTCSFCELCILSAGMQTLLA